MATRTHIGIDELKRAQEARGLSNEQVARRIDITEKTWRRWKMAGEVPAYAVAAVELALGTHFDVEPVTLDGDLMRRLREVESRMDSFALASDVEQGFRALQRRLDALALQHNGREIQPGS